MSDNKTFPIALLVSLFVHSLFFITLPHMPFTPSRRSLQKIEITYYKIKQVPKIKRIIQKKQKIVAKKLPDIRKEDILRPPKAIDKKVKKSEKPRRVSAKKELGKKRFEKIVEEEKSGAKRAVYISYYRAIRERIKYFADRNYGAEKGRGEGEVFLSFIVASSGELLQVIVSREKSTANPALRELAISSVRDASPFPPFPPGMDQYQITFNVVISYQLK